MANILVIGSGGREHAIAWKLSQSDQVGQVFVLPGSVGIATVDKVEIVSNVKLGGDFKVSKLEPIRVSYQIGLINISAYY